MNANESSFTPFCGFNFNLIAMFFFIVIIIIIIVIISIYIKKAFQLQMYSIGFSVKVFALWETITSQS